MCSVLSSGFNRAFTCVAVMEFARASRSMSPAARSLRCACPSFDRIALAMAAQFSSVISCASTSPRWTRSES